MLVTFAIFFSIKSKVPDSSSDALINVPELCPSKVQVQDRVISIHQFKTLTSTGVKYYPASMLTRNQLITLSIYDLPLNLKTIRNESKAS